MKGPIRELRSDFPIFENSDLVYLDSGATSQKPRQVIDRIFQFYSKQNAPVHRGIYTLAENTTAAFEAVRQKTADFINAESADEIVFTHGATESMNMIAQSWARQALKAGDEIVITQMEHHANIVPWQQLVKEKGVVLKWLPILPDANLDYSKLDEIITEKTKLVSVMAGSNVLGIPLDLKRIGKRAREVGAYFAVDASQSAPRRKTDVQAIDCDFLAFGSHKMLGPTGLGVLYVNKKLHEQFGPYQFGGAMVQSVDFASATWKAFPYRCEAGTPPIAQVIGFGAALDYLNDRVDFEALKKHEAGLCCVVLDAFKKLPGITVWGPEDVLRSDGHLVSFTVEGIHGTDVAEFLNQYNVAVRVGHHCAQPLHRTLRIPSSVRASFYVYTSHEDIEKFLAAMHELLV